MNDHKPVNKVVSFEQEFEPAERDKLVTVDPSYSQNQEDNPYLLNKLSLSSIRSFLKKTKKINYDNTNTRACSTGSFTQENSGDSFVSNRSSQTYKIPSVFSHTMNNSLNSYKSIESSKNGSGNSFSRIKRYNNTTVMLVITSSVFLLLHFPR